MLNLIADLRGPLEARRVGRLTSHTTAVLALWLAGIVLVSSCTVTIPGDSSGPKSTLKPITRPELLLALGDVASTLESSGAGLAGRQVTLNACIALPQLLERELNNTKGVLLLSADVPRLQLASGQCAEDPRLAANLIGAVLYETQPREGVKEPKCDGDEVEVRFGRSGLDSSGIVYLRIELVSRANHLCSVDGALTTHLLLGDGRSLAGDPFGSDSRYRTLPGRGTVQWFRVSYKATAALCTGKLIPVKALQVQLPDDAGVRTIPANAIPPIARNYCPEGPPQVMERPEASLTGP